RLIELPAQELEFRKAFHLVADSLEPRNLCGVQDDAVMIRAAAEELFALVALAAPLQSHLVLVKVFGTRDVGHVEGNVAQLPIACRLGSRGLSALFHLSRQ